MFKAYRWVGSVLIYISTRKISLISYAYVAGFPSCFSSHKLIAFCKVVPFPAIVLYKFQININ